MADSRPDPITKAANAATPGIPRAIRQRTGQTTDPVPEGMEVESPKRHFPLEPAEHDVDRTKLRAPEELGVSEAQVVSSGALVAGGGEGAEVDMGSATKDMMHKAAGEEMTRRAQKEIVKESNRREHPASNKALWQGTRSAAQKQMDSRSGPRPFTS